jgi:protein-tyrosine-phosphatase
MDRVIFACVHNAGRSQMAAVFFSALADPTRDRVGGLVDANAWRRRTAST